MENVNIIETMQKDAMRKKRIQQIKNKRMKKLKYRLVIGALATTIIGGFVIKNKMDENNQKQNQIIVDYYGAGSVEDKIVDYIEISEKLNSLNLSNCNIDESLFSKYNISNELKSPEEIKALIEKSKNFNMYISSKDLKKQSENVEISLNLIAQEKLINDYIYTTGYSKAYSDIKRATQKYAGEVYGIEDTNNINIGFDIYEGEISSNLYYNTDRGTKKTTIEKTFLSSEKNDIIDGANSISNTNTIYDSNLEDNDEYNAERNKYIKEALEQSVILNTKVEEEDLYNENLARKFR